MNTKEELRNRIRGWFPKEPTMPSSKIAKVANPPIIVRVGIIVTILAIMVAAVVLFFAPFYISQSTAYRGAIVIALAIINVIVAHAVRKIMPKPTRKEHALNILLIASVVIIAFIYVWLTRS